MIRLLFIDDDPQAQQTLKMVLEEEFEVISAFTRAEGIERVRRDDPDVVLLDINLSDIDGLEVLENIRSLPAPPSVIILISNIFLKLFAGSLIIPPIIGRPSS